MIKLPTDNLEFLIALKGIVEQEIHDLLFERTKLETLIGKIQGRQEQRVLSRDNPKSTKRDQASKKKIKTTRKTTREV